MINYVDDALYYSNDDKIKKDFEKETLKEISFITDGRSKMVP